MLVDLKMSAGGTLRFDIVDDKVDSFVKCINLHCLPDISASVVQGQHLNEKKHRWIADAQTT